MKIRCDRVALMEAVHLAGTVAVGRTTKPALLCVRLDARAEALTVAATDLELSVCHGVESVDILKPGQSVVPAERFHAILKEATDDHVEIETDGDATRITTSDAKWKVFGFDPSEFPEVPAFTDKPAFTIKAGTLKKMIRRTLFAASKELTRYSINGVLWETNGDRLRMVGTDGKRLAMANETLDAKSPEGSSVCPLKAMNLIDKLLDDPEAVAEVKFYDTEIRVRCGSVVVSSRLVEGTYPQYEKIIPAKSQRTAEFDTGKLVSAVRKSIPTSNKDSRRVLFNLSSGKMVLKSQSPECGTSVVTLATDYGGDPLGVAFDPGFMLDGLGVFDADSVRLEFSDASRPVAMRHGTEFLYVVMPMTTPGQAEDER